MKLYPLFLAFILCSTPAMAQPDSSIHVKHAPSVPLDHSQLAMGNIDSFVIDYTNYGELSRLYAKWLKEYDQGTIHFADWQGGRAPLRWGCHAYVVNNPHEDMATETGRYNRARLVPGYQYMVEYCIEVPFRMRNIELLFAPDSTLIYLKADMGHAMAKVMTDYCGVPATYKEEHDTIPWPNNPKFNTILTTITHTWYKNKLETVVTTADKLNKDGKKITTTQYQMMDMVKYGAYLDKVNKAKNELDKKYDKVKKREVLN